MSVLSSAICEIARAHHAAGAAPVGVEIEKHRLIGIQHFVLKILFAYLYHCHFFVLPEWFCTLIISDPEE